MGKYIRINEVGIKKKNEQNLNKPSNHWNGVILSVQSRSLFPRLIKSISSLNTQNDSIPAKLFILINFVHSFVYPHLIYF